MTHRAELWTKIVCIGLLLIFILSVPFVCDAGSIVITRTYFGMHMHNMRADKPWPNIPFGAWRLWDAGVAWPNLESQKGKWDFTRLDGYVALAEKHKIELLLPLGMSPQWASARPDEKSAYKSGNSAEPSSIQYWQNYVRTVATRYKGKIQAYEIWNEPNLKEFYTGDIQTLVTLSREAYRIIKEVDPQAVVVSPSATATYGIPWLDRYLDSGGGDYCDVVGYHLYIPSGEPEQLPEFINSIEKTMSKHAVNKPLWNTESGWWIGDGSKKPVWVNPKWKRLMSSESPAYISRALILAALYGVQRFYWYAWDNGDTGIEDPKTGRAHEGGNAFLALNNWLIGRTIDSCNRKPDGMWSCAIKEKSAIIGEIVWSDTNAIKVPRSLMPRYTVVEQLDGSAKLLSPNEVISITGTPIFLKVKGSVNSLRSTNNGNGVSTQTIPRIIRDEPVIIKDAPQNY